MDVLPDSIKEVAIRHAMERNKEHDKEIGKILIDVVERNSFEEALYSAFVFMDTEEGYDYWKRISVEYNF